MVKWYEVVAVSPFLNDKSGKLIGLNIVCPSITGHNKRLEYFSSLFVGELSFFNLFGRGSAGL